MNMGSVSSYPRIASSWHRTNAWRIAKLCWAAAPYNHQPTFPPCRARKDRTQLASSYQRLGLPRVVLLPEESSAGKSRWILSSPGSYSHQHQSWAEQIINSHSILRFTQPGCGRENYTCSPTAQEASRFRREALHSSTNNNHSKQQEILHTAHIWAGKDLVSTKQICTYEQ